MSYGGQTKHAALHAARQLNRMKKMKYEKEVQLRKVNLSFQQGFASSVLIRDVERRAVLVDPGHRRLTIPIVNGAFGCGDPLEDRVGRSR